jgi:ATP-dependent RNA helicase DDX3X
LHSRGFPSTSIHGDRSQLQRESALLAFRSGKRPILVATAVAARGLDIPAVGLVLVYDMPQCTDEYIHKIGRTARAGNEGKAIVFFSAGDASVAAGLIAILKNSNQKVPEFLVEMAGGDYGSSSMNYGYRDINKDIRHDRTY